jgi:hypothetical protein
MPAYNQAATRVAMPKRVSWLPISDKGFPVPWFVATIDGKPDFRVIDTPKLGIAFRRKLCWICGEPLGATFAMTVGPMCAVNRTIAEPPSHRDCAIYAAQACPFLANPQARRRTIDDMTGLSPPAEGAIMRNPGAVGVWVTNDYTPFKSEDGSILFTFADPIEVLWFAEGRAATADEVRHSVDTGLPLLFDEARRQGPSYLAELGRQIIKARAFLP